MREAADSVDDYIASFPPKVQAILKRVRQTIVKAAPDAEEKISYHMPAYMLNGPLVYFGGFKEHLGFFPPVGDPALRKEVAQYANERGNLKFMYDEPIPYPLIAKLVKARIAENAEAAAAKKRAKAVKKTVKKTPRR